LSAIIYNHGSQQLYPSTLAAYCNEVWEKLEFVNGAIVS